MQKTVAPMPVPSPITLLRSPRRRHMAAVCEQLGASRVTVRAVHRLTGGSHRDVSAVVKLWRDRQAEVGALLSGMDAHSAIQAVGAIVLGALEQQSEELRTDLREELRERLKGSTSEVMLARPQNLEAHSGATVQELRAHRAAVDQQLQTLNARLAVLTRKIEDAAQVVTVSPDLSPSEPAQRLQSQLAEVHRCVEGLEQRLDATLARTEPARDVQAAAVMTAPLEERLVSLEDTLHRVSEQLSGTTRRRRAPGKRTRAAPRKRARATVKRKAPQRPRGAAHRSVSSPRRRQRVRTRANAVEHRPRAGRAAPRLTATKARHAGRSVPTQSRGSRTVRIPSRARAPKRVSASRRQSLRSGSPQHRTGDRSPPAHRKIRRRQQRGD